MLLASAALAAPAVRLELLAPRRAPPGQAVEVALVLHVPRGWHVYWENPGQSGLATVAGLEAPGAVGAARWSTPERIEAEWGLNYGYTSEAAAVWRVDPTADGTLAATAQWVLCREVCTVGEGTVQRPIRLGRGTRSRRVARWIDRLPAPFPGDSGGTLTWSEGALELVVPGPGPFEIFPSTALEAAWRPRVVRAGPDLVLEAAVDALPSSAFLVVTRGRTAWMLTLENKP